MGGKRVSQRVRRQWSAYAGTRRRIAQYVENHNTRQMSATAVEEHRIGIDRCYRNIITVGVHIVFMRVNATSLTGTSRSLEPLPLISITALRKSMCEICSAHNSETRSPQPYMVSTIARLRRPVGVSSIAAIKASISSNESTEGRREPTDGLSSNSVGSVSMMPSRRK